MSCISTYPNGSGTGLRGLIVSEIDDMPVLEQIKDGIRKIKAIRQGKTQAKDLDELLSEMRNERKDKSPIAL